MKRIIQTVFLFLFLLSLLLNSILGVLYFRQQSEILNLNHRIALYNEVSYNLENSDSSSNSVNSEIQNSTTVVQNENILDALNPNLNYFFYSQCNVAAALPTKMNSEDYAGVESFDLGRKWEANVTKVGSHQSGRTNKDILYVGFNPSLAGYQEDSLRYASGYVSASYSLLCYQPTREIKDLNDFFEYKKSEFVESQQEGILTSNGIIDRWNQKVLSYSLKGGFAESTQFFLTIVDGKYYEITYLSFTNNQEIKASAEFAFENIFFY